MGCRDFYGLSEPFDAAAACRRPSPLSLKTIDESVNYCCFSAPEGVRLKAGLVLHILGRFGRCLRGWWILVEGWVGR